MVSLRSRITSSLPLLKHRPWPASIALAPQLNGQELIEEENTPNYSPAHFYPAYVGEVLNDRYQIASKIGYGSNSTVWLARDLTQWRWLRNKYVALKINSSACRAQDIETELQNLRLLYSANPRHRGYSYVRHLDWFELKQPSRKHLALVFEPLREPLWIYRRRFVGDTIPSDILKIMLQIVLQGLDYLHTECHLIRTGPPSKGHSGIRETDFAVLRFGISGPEIGTGFYFETSLSKISGEDKRMFIDFGKGMIRWRPEERATAKQLLEDPWLSFEAK